MSRGYYRRSIDAAYYDPGTTGFGRMGYVRSVRMLFATGFACCTRTRAVSNALSLATWRVVDPQLGPVLSAVVTAPTSISEKPQPWSLRIRMTHPSQCTLPARSAPAAKVSGSASESHASTRHPETQVLTSEYQALSSTRLTHLRRASLQYCCA